MSYGIFTATGNLVAWFDSEREALAGLAREEPEAAGEVAAVPFDDEGRPCGPGVIGSALLASAGLAEVRRRVRGKLDAVALVREGRDELERRTP